MFLCLLKSSVMNDRITARGGIMNHHTFDRLPERLTISFPLWLIYGTKGENSPYYDIDKTMREHVERGFNCIRIDSGAGALSTTLTAICGSRLT